MGTIHTINIRNFCLDLWNSGQISCNQIKHIQSWHTAGGDKGKQVLIQMTDTDNLSLFEEDVKSICTVVLANFNFRHKLLIMSRLFFFFLIWIYANLCKVKAFSSEILGNPKHLFLLFINIYFMDVNQVWKTSAFLTISFLQ